MPKGIDVTPNKRCLSSGGRHALNEGFTLPVTLQLLRLKYLGLLAQLVRARL